MLAKKEKKPKTYAIPTRYGWRYVAADGKEVTTSSYRTRKQALEAWRKGLKKPVFEED